ncbi:glycoside hydrolase family 16 protein [Nocardioides marmorisolisilvae]|uniref:Glycoside hydrolase family 16 protein n=1 Tax=Nocardioides marmorisolisilvae TaxID=1542737 RepID=A0A3N0DZB3_9ACTN|nr:glycoside hydrolase family 16 protein [Nocardioides marmorisolisilvae]RNL80955.1 glycoside hydrolase family 16 protein [Nocardioides marmorisolisilvae]
MKYAVALLLAVTGTFVLAQPSNASSRPHTVVGTPSVHRVGHEFVVKGRVSAHVKSVKIQKRVGKVWVTARRVKVHHRTYTARVPAATTTSTALRAASTTTTSRTVVVKPAGSDSCGTRPAKADGSLWSCSFVDDFSGTSLDRSKWAVQTQFASGVQATHACYVDDPSVVNVGGGTLNLTVRKVSTPVSCSFGGMSGPTNYIGGSVFTYRLFSQQYGRFEVRMKNTASSFQGLHEAFWMWPDDRYSSGIWPMSGEIDVAELYSYYPNLVVPFLHYGYGMPVTPGTNTAWNCAAQRGVYNTYTLIWSANRLEIQVNGKTCLVNTSGDAAFQKPYIMALTQALGAAGNEYDGRAPVPATMNVDYVKVWK